MIFLFSWRKVVPHASNNPASNGSKKPKNEHKIQIQKRPGTIL